jgi:hypothetical protein
MQTNTLPDVYDITVLHTYSRFPYCSALRRPQADSSCLIQPP